MKGCQEVQLELRQVLGKIEERIEKNSVKLSTLADRLEHLSETFTNRIEIAEHLAACARKEHKRAILVLQNETPYNQRRSYTSEDEAWKSFLENPLTAATKAMMSINGDEDSAAALGLLYDYYKVPREKRTISPSKPEIITTDTDLSKRSCTIPVSEPVLSTDSKFQVLKGVPLNFVLPANQITQEKRGNFQSPDTTVTVSIAAVPSYPVKTEVSSHGFMVGIPPVVHCTEPDSRIVVFDRAINQDQFSPSTQPPNSQRRTPDSTFTDGTPEFSFPGDIPLRMPAIAPEDYPFDSMTSSTFEYTLEASKSLRQKPGDGTMTYLNKGQFYPITLKETGNNKGMLHTISKVRYIICLLFTFTADYKESFNTISNIEEIAYNAISFTWDINDEAKIFVSVNCLSTDFSSQKGVKGLPLNLQIDTYSYNNRSNKPIHRAYCQIKVFCDKGAERKIRDEERKQSKRKGKCPDLSSPISTFSDVKMPIITKRTDITVFKPMSDLETQPVLFIPDLHFTNFPRHTFVSEEMEEGAGMKRLPFVSEEDFGSPSSKVPRLEEPKKVLLYVRKESEEVFDALMLKTPCLKGLMEAISDKYEVPIEKMGKVYKKCKKGITVNMDDNIVKHYSNEDTFQIQIEETGGTYKLTLTEI
ncbi:GRHL1 protein, partial [Polypterus senegalus]